MDRKFIIERKKIRITVYSLIKGNDINSHNNVTDYNYKVYSNVGEDIVCLITYTSDIVT